MCGGRGDQDVARLVLTGFGIAVSEIFAKIRDAALKFVSLCLKSLLIVQDANILFAQANAF